MIDASLIDPDLTSRGVLVRRGLVLLLLLALAGALLLAYARGTFSDDVTVHAQLDDVGGALVPGSDVKVDGNVVGRVSRIGASDGGVRLD
ncbi:MAG: MCE family protein, partial [Actinomycetales bacterium]